MNAIPLDEQVLALDEGRAYAELDDHVVTTVTGADARRWLNDLVTTDVETLEPGRSRTSMLLTPTGRIRALFHVLCVGEHDFLLVQRADQDERVERLLEPYVLSSAVNLRRSGSRLFAMPGASSVDPRLGDASSPSVLGGGVDLVLDDANATDVVRGLLEDEGWSRVGADVVEGRRISRRQPRFGVDLDPGSFPAEAGLDAAPVTDRGKGCFLGQEAVAKIANLGHPPRIVLAVDTDDGDLRAGATVSAGGEPVGIITSASNAAGLIRVRWGASSGGLRVADGARLHASPPALEPV